MLQRMVEGSRGRSRRSCHSRAIRQTARSLAFAPSLAKHDCYPKGHKDRQSLLISNQHRRLQAFVETVKPMGGRGFAQARWIVLCHPP